MNDILARLREGRFRNSPIASVAVHEAAHAVAVALSTSMLLVDVSIEADATTNGRVAFKSEGPNWEQASMFLAGPLAVAHFTQKPVDWDYDPTADLFRARQVIARLTMHHEAALESLISTTTDQVRNRWPLIHRVAVELVWQKTLTGDDVANLIAED